MPFLSLVSDVEGDVDAIEARRLALFTRVLAGSTLFCLAFCWKLWLTRPVYPMVPVGGLVPPFPYPFDCVALAAFVGLLVAVAAWPGWRVGVWLLLGAFVVFFLQDQNRLWPSFYQFFVLFLLLAARRPGAEGRVDSRDAGRVLAGMRFVLAAIYFWAGVHKLNPAFFREEFPWFLEPVTSRLPFEVGFLPWVAPVAAGLELLVGVGLMTGRFRRPALIGAVAMHALILACIGPLRDNWSNSSWAWGMTVAVQTVVLFAAAPAFSFGRMLGGSWRLRLAPLAAVLLIGVAPALNLVNRWDSAASFNVYSGNISVAEVHFFGGAAERLPPDLQELAPTRFGRAVLRLNDWSLREFNSHVYPQNRVFLAIFRRLCEGMPEGAAELHVREKSSWLSPKQTHVYDWPPDY